MYAERIHESLRLARKLVELSDLLTGAAKELALESARIETERARAIMEGRS